MIRPENHRIGELAEIAVMELFTSVGWIVNKVSRDYGEDLYVQVCQSGKITPFRFYVQIKGTNDIRRFEKKHFYSCRDLTRSTVARWLVSSDVIMLIIWDINKRSGVYGFIQDIFDDNLLVDSCSENITARISKNCLINKEAVDVIGKQVMLKWASKASREAEATIDLARAGDIEEEPAKAHYVNIGINILLALEVIYEAKEIDGVAYLISKEIIEEFNEEFSSLLDKRIKRKKKLGSSLKRQVEDCIEATWVLILIRRFNKMTKQPAEHSALSLSWRLITHLYSLSVGTKDMLDDLVKTIENHRSAS